MATGCVIHELIPSRTWPGTAKSSKCSCWMRRRQWNGTFVLDDKPAYSASRRLSYAEADATQRTPSPHQRMRASHFNGSYVLGMGFVLEPTRKPTSYSTRTPQQRCAVSIPQRRRPEFTADQSPSRWVINFFDWPLIERRSDGYQASCRDFPNASHRRGKVKPERTRTRLTKDEFCIEADCRKDGGITATSGPNSMQPSLIWNVCSVSPLVSKTLRILSLSYRHRFLARTSSCLPSINLKIFAVLQSALHEVWARHYAQP